MSGKHPIDDLFARHLRDAEAPPPAAIWEGIMRERGARQRGLAMRRRWGLAALLLLFLGGAGFWALAPKDTASPSTTAQLPSEVAPKFPAQPVLTHTGVAQSPAAISQTTPAGSGTRTEHEQETDVHQNTADGMPAAEPEGKDESRLKKPRPNPRAKKPAETIPIVNMGAIPIGGPLTNTTHTTKDNQNAPESSSATSAPDLKREGKDMSANVPLPSIAENRSVPFAIANTSQPSLEEEQPMRSTPDVHLPKLDALVSTLATSTVATLGPILKGDSTPAYVLNKGNWWIAAQVELTMLNAEWRGSGTEVTALNESEKWRGAQGLAVAFGREWLNGWSIGLGFGVNKQRSRFLRHEVDPSRTETVIDTTWTGSPLGTATNYTWDIVETQRTETGVEHDYSATNSYTRLRISPELGYQLLQKKRFTLGARLAPVMMIDIGRTGNTLVTASAMESVENLGTTIATIALNDASLDARFPLSFAISAGLDLRYRLCAHWSLGVLPAFTYWLPPGEGRVPALSMKELGGAVRLRYDFRHKEQRVK